MRSRLWPSLSIAFATLLVASIPLSGCGSTKCLDCAGDDPCPALFGTYVGTQQGTMDTCGSWYLVEGESVLRVVTQEGNKFEVELQDNRGLWALFEGELCNTNKQDPPRFYNFYASYEVNEVAAAHELFYDLSGSFKEAGASSAARVDGTLTISLFFPDRPESNCTLSGPFDGELIE